MQPEEQRLINDLFDRLKQAETASSSRDTEAQAAIEAHIRQQPGAPYYMAQTILIQEAAIKQLSAQVESLQSQITQHQESKPSSGGFLAGLFGGGNQQPLQPQNSNPIPGSQRYQASANPSMGYQSAPPSYGAQSAARGGGFMAGALQTAAGVAGGVVLGNMLTNMFQHHQPEEIVNIINEPAPQDPGLDQNNLNNDDISRQDAAWQQDGNGFNNDFDNTGFDDNGFDSSGDDFGGDDDSWV